jgi:NAD+ diphosphatase
MAPSTNVLAGIGLDRQAERRGDQGWLESRLQRDDTRLLVIRSGRALVTDGDDVTGLAMMSWSEFRAVGVEPEYLAFLGISDGDQAFFAASLTDGDDLRFAERIKGRFGGLRSLAGQLDRYHTGLAAYARAMDLWQREHRYCGRCGTVTDVDTGGFRRRCRNPDCNKEHFPRLDPAIIVIVGHQGRCLLGRQPEWPPGRYSTLAGFVEPGESLEEAVAREVMEEAGVAVASSSYHSSQPWPFPSSLMLGFVAEASSDAIQLGNQELEDARWFTAAELEQGVAAGDLVLPTRFSVSFRLVAHWMKREHGIDIRDWEVKKAWS